MNRLALAQRVEAGMSNAWASTTKQEVAAKDIEWRVEAVALPLAKHLSVAGLMESVRTNRAGLKQADASRLAWVKRCEGGHKVELSGLKIGPARVLHMPGELFVEYQLAAKAHRPDLFVAMAAYGDYALWYIGTAAAYSEGGYETEPRSSNVAPESEAVLLEGMRKLLAE